MELACYLAAAIIPVGSYGQKTVSAAKDCAERKSACQIDLANYSRPTYITASPVADRTMHAYKRTQSPAFKEASCGEWHLRLPRTSLLISPSPVSEQIAETLILRLHQSREKPRAYTCNSLLEFMC